LTCIRLLPLVFALLLAREAAAQSGPAYGPVGPPVPGPLHIIGGGPNGGCIAGAVRLPPEGGWYETIHGRISHFWGAPVTIQGIVTLAEKAHANGLPPLLIEDISRPRGGPMPGGHAAHQVGLDVDVALDMRTRGYLTDEQRDSIQIASLVRPDYRDIEPSMWSDSVARLLWLAATLPGVDRVLVNAAIKQQLCRTVTSGAYAHPLQMPTGSDRLRVDGSAATRRRMRRDAAVVVRPVERADSASGGTKAEAAVTRGVLRDVRLGAMRGGSPVTTTRAA
jgi:murein endopeptidase